MTAKLERGYFRDDPDKAYNEFLSTFSMLYDKHCPLTARKINKYKDKPWITKGLEKACKKKNILYKQFLTSCTKEAESKYKKYKNKLTNETK